MSLLDTASLIVTPNGYKGGVTTGKLYSVKPTDASGDMVVSRATTATRVNSAGLIESVAINVPRLDYTGGSCPSILVEPERTNRLLRSEEFDNVSWNKSAITITANATTSPSETLTAHKFIPTAGFSAHNINQAGLPSNTYTFSVFAKAGGETTFSLWLANASKGAIFDLSTGTYTLSNATSANIENYGNGWYRCSVYSSTAGTTAHIYGRSGGGFEGNDTDGIFLWGAQAEADTSPTSYIPTTTAAVTRNADVISKTGVSSLIGQTEGTIYAEIKVTKLLGAASRYILHVSDGTANNRIYIAFSSAASNVLRARIFNGGTLQCSINSSALTSTGTYKLAMAYKNNDIVFYVNGVQIGTDVVATIPTCSRVDIGQNYNNVAQLSDNISLSTLFPTRLTNAQLATLTTL
jgi:hypothetical protein